MTHASFSSHTCVVDCSVVLCLYIHLIELSHLSIGIDCVLLQLVKIVKVLGTDVLFAYLEHYHLELPGEYDGKFR